MLGFGRLTEHYAFPGLPAYDANQRILATYGNGGDQRPYVPVIRLPDGASVTSAESRESLRRAFDRVAEQQRARVVSYPHTGDTAFVGRDGRTVVGLVYAGPEPDGSPPGGGLGETADRVPAIAAALRSALPPGTSVEVTGLDALAPGEDAGGLDVPVKIAVGLAAAVLVLLFVFRSALALVPVLIALVAIPAACLLLMLLTLVTTCTRAP